jgi:hypothetical protein
MDFVKTPRHSDLFALKSPSRAMVLCTDDNTDDRQEAYGSTKRHPDEYIGSFFEWLIVA